MSVVRIPRPEEDRFPLARTLAGAAAGASIGLAIAYWGMERDRASEDSVEIDSSGAPAPAPLPAAEPVPVPVPVPVPAAEPVPEPVPVPAPAADAVPAPARESAGTGATPGTSPAAVTRTETEAAGRVGPVTLRPGRVAYLRCDGVPQREGAFPCPRDPALETAVWQSLAALDRCELAPGAADLVVDIGATGAAAIRSRDTFPPDVVRADGAAILACAGESLGAVRSSLSPERLVVSFRLTLAPAGR